MLVAMTLALATIPQLADEYLRELWRDSPMAASAAGYHQDGVDERLDDESAAARAKRSAFLRGLDGRVAAAAAATHDPEELADAALLRAQIAVTLQELDEARTWARRCDTPLDALGSTFFQMVVQPYAPLERRARDAVARLRAVPRYLAEVRDGLEFDVEPFRLAAKDDGEGLIDYLQHELQPAFAAAPNSAEVRAAVESASAAVNGYLGFVARELPKRPKGTFRWGRALYEKRFGPYLQTDLAPAAVLAAAEQRLAALHVEMRQIAASMHAPDVRAALAEVARDHPTPQTLFSTVKQQVDDARAFVRARGLLTLAAHDNLMVVETPPFMRSFYAVAGFEGAPPLAPSQGAFYYVTPLPADWPADKVESKLREYNRWMLDVITVHEAMPGHYVQFEHANAVVPEWRRVLRNLLGADSYVEGWAVYAQDLMVDSGYRGGAPALKLSARKMELRAVINAILDIRLHMHDLSDEEALKLMMEQGFQERAEAEAKLRRAKLSTTQLCAYFVGGEGWRALRQFAASKGMALSTFHDRALAEGAVPLSSLRTLLSR
jgi:uncharacterized protein (DUF885 family)